jgi:hypothetical protein
MTEYLAHRPHKKASTPPEHTADSDLQIVVTLHDANIEVAS